MALRTAILTFIVVLYASTAAADKHIVRMPLKGPAQVAELQARGIEILALTKDGMDLLVDDKQLAHLERGHYPVTVMENIGAERTTPLDANLNTYTTYAELQAALTSLAATYPSIFSTFSVGTSIEGRTIYGIKISDNVGTDEDEPEVLIQGNLHARELMAVEMPLMLAQYLTSNYGSDATVTDLVNNREIYIIPMCNPDGHVYVENNHAGHWSGWWRKNRRDNGGGIYGVDLNRNYGYEWGYDNVGSSPSPSSEVYRGTGPFSEPETQALRTFVNSRQFTLWLSFHSYGDLLLYGWGYQYANTPDHDVFLQLGIEMSASNGYFAGNPASGAIYITNGDSDDWGYGEQGEKPKIYAFTPEVNTYAEGGFGPCDTLIVPTFNKNLDMMLLALDYADTPERVVGPYAPVLDPVQMPFSSDVQLLTWSDNDPLDPNPVATWEIEGCHDPSLVVNTGVANADISLDGFTVSGSGHTGNGFFSGSGDNLSNTLAFVRPLVVDSEADTIGFWTTYDIELDWDYGYVEVSTDAGASWTTVQGSITTTNNPNGNNLGNGITGSSGGWVYATFPLTAWLGQEVLLRFAYVTDGYVANPGWYIDDIDPVPTCGSIATVASGITAPEKYLVPTALGTWRYRVRATDADGDMSRWSNSEDGSVNSLTAADLVYASSLGSNYPNPFNPTTTIPYVVGGRSDGTGANRRVSLRIYDVTGALVRTLVDASRAPGRHQENWNGIDDTGVPATTGVYFARLVIDGEAVATRKLVLIK